MMKSVLIIALSFLCQTALAQFEEGDLLPDIDLPGVDGEHIKLSSLRGQMVFVDFWASWCKPCRKENPEIRKAYLAYKDEEFDNGEGFTVYSVSLDKSREAWEKAVIRDGLVWKNHVSDLKGWKNEAAVRFGISSLPMSYLIDGDGRVVAVNPRGNKLEKELKKSRKSTSFFQFLFNW